MADEPILRKIPRHRVTPDKKELKCPSPRLIGVQHSLVSNSYSDPVHRTKVKLTDKSKLKTKPLKSVINVAGPSFRANLRTEETGADKLSQSSWPARAIK